MLLLPCVPTTHSLTACCRGADDDDKAIAAAHNKSAAQVALRWVLQREAIFVTAGTEQAYLQEDLDVFDFELSDAEMHTLDDK
jgi:diketogulonate reductase-like aldo/keto reductase